MESKLFDKSWEDEQNCDDDGVLTPKSRQRKEAAAELRKAGLRVEVDLRNEKINYKVREHSHQKVPIIAVVGRQEMDDRTLALRRFGDAKGRPEVVELAACCEKLRAEAAPPDLRET